MRIKYHYAPAISAHSRLTNFLEKRNISYELCPLVGGTNYRLCVFDLYRDQDEFIEFRIRFPFLSWITESIEYTESEIETAEWLFVRSMSKLVKWEYHSSAFQQSCEYKKPFLHDKYYKHSEQIKPLTATQKMKWSTRRYFSGPDTAEDFIFCSKRAKNMLDGKWKGLNFFNVIYIPILIFAPQLIYSGDLPSWMMVGLVLIGNIIMVVFDSLYLRLENKFGARIQALARRR